MKVATRDENKKYEAVFKIEYMSEDEDRTDGEGLVSPQVELAIG